MLFAGFALIAISLFDLVASLVLASRRPQAALILRVSALVTLVIGVVLVFLA